MARGGIKTSLEGKARTRGAALIKMKGDRQGRATASHQAAQPFPNSRAEAKPVEIYLREL